MFSWFDSYDIYDEDGNTVYTVKGQLSWGHCLVIYDSAGYEIGTVKERVLTFLPKFEMYMGSDYVGCITKEFSLFRPRFTVECNGWSVDGDLFGWDYTVYDCYGARVATVTKELFKFTDTYSIDVANTFDSLCVLMLVLAIDAQKCTASK